MTKRSLLAATVWLWAAPVGAQTQTPAPAQPPQAGLESAAFLAGCWQADGGEPGSGESWMAPAGGALLGANRRLRGGRMVGFEFMLVRSTADGSLAFIALPSGRNLTTFALAEVAPGRLVFSNPGHDFPQRVIYSTPAPGRLLGRIEGLNKGQPLAIDFPFSRVACDPAPNHTAAAPPPGPTVAKPTP